MGVLMDYREGFLLPYIQGKKVLDLGVGDIRDRFLHRFISQHARSAIGVELDTERAKKLNDMGYHIIVGNAETIRLKDTFDVIVAGDLIEHVSNAGLLLANVARHLKKKGLFIFNTPNAYSINMLIRYLFTPSQYHQFNEHSAAYTEDLLKVILSRQGYSIKKIIYFSSKNAQINSVLIRLFARISKYWNEQIAFVVSHE